MLEYDRIDNSEGIDSTKNKLASKECWLCSFWHFIDKYFRFQRYYCDGCCDISMKSVSMHNIAIVYVKGNAYRINFAFMTKNDAINKMNNANLNDKKGVL